MLALDPDSEEYKQLYNRYYAALSLQYTGYKNLLLELVQSDMSVAVVENVEGIMPYEVIFADKLPGQASEAYMFYPQGYMKLKTGISIYPDDAPENIMNQISYDSDNCLISNNYLMDGEFLILYRINNIWYRFTFEMLDNKLVKVNGIDVDLSFYKNIWFDKISKELTSEIDITKYFDIDSIMDIRVPFSNLKGKIDVTKYYDIISNIVLKSTSTLKSNIISTIYNDILFKLNVKNISDLDSKLEVLRYDDLNSDIKVLNYNDNLGNIIVTKVDNLNSHIDMTNSSNLKSNIISTKYSDLISSTFIQYTGYDDKTSQVQVRNFSDLPSFISSDRTVNNLDSNMTVRVWANSDVQSHIFIIGKGKLTLPSHTIIMYRSSIHSHINIVKSSTIKSKITIKPRYFNYLHSNIKIMEHSNLYSSLNINPHDVLTANFGSVYTNNSDLKFNIKIRTEGNNYFYGHLYVNNIIELDATAKTVYSGNSDIFANMMIPTGNNIQSNIIINGRDNLQGSIITIPNNISDINCNIKIATNSDLASILFIPYKDILNGTTVITNMGINEIHSNINIVYAGVSDILGKLEVAPHDVVNSDVIINSSYLSTLTGQIKVTNSSSLLSNIFVQPNGLSDGETVINAGDENNILSNIIVTFTNDITSNINVNINNAVYGEVAIIGIGNDLSSNIIIKQLMHNDLISNIEVPYVSPNNLDGTINIVDFNSNGASLDSNIRVTNLSQIKSTLTISTSDINKFDANIIIDPRSSENLISNVDVRNTSDLIGNVIITSLNLGYAVSNIVTNVTSSLDSNIIITSFNAIKSNIKVVEKTKLIVDAEVFEATNVKQFTPVKDAAIIESTPTINYGKSQSLYVGNTPTGHVRSLLGFNVFGIDDVIVSAYLIFRSSDYSNFDQLQIYSESYNWEEYGVTWNNAPTNGSYISSKDSTGTRTIVSFNVTDYVKYMLEQVNTKQIAFSLRQSTSIISSTKRFYSRETDQSPILKVTYASDILGKLGASVLKSHVDIGTLKSSSLKSHVDIINTHMIEANDDLESNIIISSSIINDLYSTMEVKGATISGNVCIRRHDNSDLIGQITPKLRCNSNLHSSINISKPVIPANVIIKQHSQDDNISNIIIKQSGYKDMPSKITMTRTHVTSEIKVAWNNTTMSNIVVRRHSYNEITANLVVNIKYIPCNIVVTNTESRLFNIIIRQHTYNDLASSLYMRPIGTSDLEMSIKIRHNDDRRSHISITRPKINSNIIVRQHANSDLVSSIKVYVFEGYITII